jgi:hypothetical protein
MRNALAKALPLLIIFILAGCQNTTEQKAPSPPVKASETVDAAEIRQALEASLPEDWKIGAVSEVDSPEGWLRGAARGVEIILAPPNPGEEDAEYKFWVFGSQWSGKKKPLLLMTAEPGSFYYNENRDYMLFFQPDTKGQIPFLALNHVALALGITDAGAEAASFSREDIERAVAAIFSQGAESERNSLKSIRLTASAVFLTLNTLDDPVADSFISACARAFPEKTRVILRSDGRQQDSIISGRKK